MTNTQAAKKLWTNAVKVLGSTNSDENGKIECVAKGDWLVTLNDGTEILMSSHGHIY